MAEFPSMPLWTDAYLADTAHLTNEEHGAYLRLLMFAWRTPDCSLPNNDKRLAIMLGISPKKWASIKGQILSFWTVEEDTLTQKRLTAERKKVKRSREQKSSAGAQSAKAKSLKNNNTGSTAVVTATSTERQQNVNKPSPSPERVENSSLSLTIKNEKPRTDADAFSEVLSPVLDGRVLKELIAHRKHKKARLSEATAKLILKAARECNLSPNQAAITMIERGWVTIKPDWLRTGNTPRNVGEYIDQQMKDQENVKTSFNGSSGFLDEGETGRNQSEPSFLEILASTPKQRL